METLCVTILTAPPRCPDVVIRRAAWKRKRQKKCHEQCWFFRPTTCTRGSSVKREFVYALVCFSFFFFFSTRGRSRALGVFENFTIKPSVYCYARLGRVVAENVNTAETHLSVYRSVYLETLTVGVVTTGRLGTRHDTTLLPRIIYINKYESVSMSLTARSSNSAGKSSAEPLKTVLFDER